MKLFAISDLHLASADNRDALAALPEFPDDWVILAATSPSASYTCPGFRRVHPPLRKGDLGRRNHELWCIPKTATGRRRGRGALSRPVDLARSFGVVTPEDPYPLWTGPGGDCVIAPLFLLYDYSFRPASVARDEVVSWADARHNVCADEMLLDPAPHASREAWCAARCRWTEERLAELDPALPTVLINHFPLREDLIHIPRAPRFTPWCGTTATADWHGRFRASVAVSGHLHVRRTDWRDGTRFEEVSLGHPRQWDPRLGMAHYLREILPGPAASG